MKNLQFISPFLTSLLLASMALAQVGNLPDAPQPQDAASTDVQPVQTPNPAAPRSGEKKLITQAVPFPRSPHGPMPPPRGRAYPSAFAPRPPALSPVGALIGFGAGAALGATASGDQTARGRVAGALIGGTLCALIGGAIGRGFAIGGHNYHHWDDAPGDDAKKRKHVKPVPRLIEPEVDASTTLSPTASVGSL
jgi:hypothetical protein